MLLVVGAAGGVLIVAFTFFSQQPNNRSLITKSTDLLPRSGDQDLTRYPQYIEASQNAGLVYYIIPELGIRMRLNEKFAKDLIYSVAPEKNADGELWDAVYFSTLSLTSVDENCSPENGRMATLVKVPDASEALPIINGIVKHFPDFDLIIFPGFGESACWNARTEKLARAAIDARFDGVGAKTIQDALNTIQLNIAP